MKLLLWPSSRSYTGQPSAEIHTLGSPPILEALLEQLYRLGAKPAQRGEFTLRAFLSGKISLVQAEAVLGVIEARTDSALDQALEQLAGGLSPQIRNMRDQLLEDLADLEAGLDFVDEDIEFVDHDQFRQRIETLHEELRRLSDAAGKRMINSTERNVVLAGLPNAGKSTLFNCLTEKEALVSDIEGTTTDYLVATVNWDGIQIAFHDTAGWDQETTKTIDTIAQDFREKEYQNADLILWCTPADLSSEKRDKEFELAKKVASQGLPVALLTTKADLMKEKTQTEIQNDSEFPISLKTTICAETENGIEEFKSELLSLLDHQNTNSVFLGSTASRCKDSLGKSKQHLEETLQLLHAGAGDELIAEEIRCTLHELGLILGHVYTDDLLDVVFSRFCIGK